MVVMVLMMIEAAVPAIELWQVFGPEHFGRYAKAKFLVIQTKNIARVLIDDIEIMGDDQDGQSEIFLQVCDHAIDGFLSEDVDVRCRLVEQKDIRVAKDGPADRKTLALPHGKFSEPGAENGWVQLDIPQYLVDLFFGNGTIVEMEKFFYGQWDVGFDLESLGDIADLCAGIPGDRAFMGNDAKKCLEQCGLSGTVGSNNGKNIAFLYGEADVVEDGGKGGAHLQMFNF